MTTERAEELPAQNAGNKSPIRSAAGWIITLLVIFYAGYVHNGMGVPPNDNATEWWHATGFLTDYDMVGSWMVDVDDDGTRQFPTSGVIWLTLPALLATLLIFALTPSAIARALAITSTVCVPMFAFYGLSAAMQMWQLFHWRASVVFTATAAALGLTLAAPWLARSWMRQHPVVQLLLYLPLFIAIVSIVRQATGTDEKLFFNFSPWPAIPIIGLEMGAYSMLGVLWGVGMGLGGLSLRRTSPGWSVAGLITALVLPGIWFASRFGSDMTGLMVGLGIVSLLLVGVGYLSTRSKNQRARLASGCVATLVGATLAFAPLASGRAMATGDYIVNKFVRSQKIIDALAKYYAETNEGYPDSLQTLVDKDYLDEIPKPRLGFQFYYQLGIFKPYEFFYQSLGSSYVLEFTSTEWVQCAYNPPWAEDDSFGDDEYEDDEYEDDEYEDDDESGDAWNCPDKRPELW